MAIKNNNKNSDKLELNQRPKDNRATLQSSALPAELLSESVYCSSYPYKSDIDSHLFLQYDISLSIIEKMNKLD